MFNNLRMSKLSPKQVNLLNILVALNAWEKKNCPSIETQSGRSLYFQLAQTLLTTNEGEDVLMKQRLGDASERSMRDHVRSFQAAGLLTEKNGTLDARTKQILPTEKLTNDLISHLELFMRLIENRYLLVEK
jgi:hypothetical protein